MVHTQTWACVALPELIFNRLLCAGENTTSFLSENFLCSVFLVSSVQKQSSASWQRISSVQSICVFASAHCGQMPNKIKGNWLYVLWCITLLLGLVQDLLKDVQIPPNAVSSSLQFSSNSTEMQGVQFCCFWSHELTRLCAVKCNGRTWKFWRIKGNSLDSGELQRGTSHVVTCLCSFSSLPGNFFCSRISATARSLCPLRVCRFRLRKQQLLPIRMGTKCSVREQEWAAEQLPYLSTEDLLLETQTGLRCNQGCNFSCNSGGSCFLFTRLDLVFHRACISRGKNRNL